METSLLLMEQVASMLVMVAIGVLVARAGLITEEQSVGLSNLTVYVFCPCMVLGAYQVDFSMEKVVGLGLSIGCAFLVHGLFMLVSRIVLRRGENIALERTAVVFTNSGNICFPILTAALGTGSLFYASGYLFTFNLLLWTVGVAQICGNRSMCSFKKVFLNPNILAIFAGMLLFLLRVRLPHVIQIGVSAFSGMVAPVSMLVLGFELSRMRFKALFCSLRLYWVCFLRLILFPLLLLLVFKGIFFTSWTADSAMIAMVMLIIGSAPSAASIPMLAQIFRLDAEYGARLVAMSTLLSVATMPLITAAGQLALFS